MTPRAAPSSPSWTGSPAITTVPRSRQGRRCIRDPKNLDAYKTLIRSNLDRKQYAMAELVGVRALKISTTDPDLYLAIGDTQLAKGGVDKAAASTRRRSRPARGSCRAAGAREARAQGRGLRAAEKHLSRAVADGGGSAEVHLDLGVAYRGLGQPDKALAEYEAAEKLQPKLAAIYLNRGIVLQRYKDAPEKSLELYKQYVALSGGESALPNDAPVLALRREAERWWRRSRRPRFRSSRRRRWSRRSSCSSSGSRTPRRGRRRERRPKARHRTPESKVRTNCRRVWSVHGEGGEVGVWCGLSHSM
jgi:tetratricopeptide (TPR) repeat protein